MCGNPVQAGATRWQAADVGRSHAWGRSQGGAALALGRRSLGHKAAEPTCRVLVVAALLPLPPLGLLLLPDALLAAELLAAVARRLLATGGRQAAAAAAAGGRQQGGIVHEQHLQLGLLAYICLGPCCVAALALLALLALGAGLLAATRLGCLGCIRAGVVLHNGKQAPI